MVGRWVYRNIWDGVHDPRNDENNVPEYEVEEAREDAADYQVLVNTDRLVILSFRNHLSIHIYAFIDG